MNLTLCKVDEVEVPQPELGITIRELPARKVELSADASQDKPHPVLCSLQKAFLQNLRVSERQKETQWCSCLLMMQQRLVQRRDAPHWWSSFSRLRRKIIYWPRKVPAIIQVIKLSGGRCTAIWVVVIGGRNVCVELSAM